MSVSMLIRISDHLQVSPLELLQGLSMIDTLSDPAAPLSAEAKAGMSLIEAMPAAKRARALKLLRKLTEESV